MEPSWDPKSSRIKENGIKKQSDFKTKLIGDPMTIGPRSLPRQPPLAAAYMRALSSQNIQVRTKREERRGKKEERKKGRREEEGRRTRGKRIMSGMTERAL